jgi:hypothetical protein
MQGELSLMAGVSDPEDWFLLDLHGLLTVKAPVACSTTDEFHSHWAVVALATPATPPVSHPTLGIKQIW